MGQLVASITTEPIFAANDQPDVASLTANGVFYRCFVYLDRTTWAIRACCYRVQTDGREVVVFNNIIVRATSTEIDNTNGIPLDCPKIIASGSRFVVHWLQATTISETFRDWALYRATMDMTAFSATSWTSQGSVALLASHILYDVCPLIGHATDFLVARYTAVGTATIVRYDDLAWVDTVWSITPTLNMAPKVLGLYAHDSDNDVVISYEANTAGNTTSDLGQLWSARVNASNGAGLAGPTQTMTEFSTAAGASGAHFMQVGHCRTAANRVAVVTEALARDLEGDGITLRGRGWIHHLVYRTISTDNSAQVSNIHWAANLYMSSRPWSYAGGDSTTAPTMEVYCLAAYRSCVDAYERTGTVVASGGDAWMQSYFYALNLDFRLWDTVADGAGLRPRVIDTLYTVGIPDGRATGWRPQEGGVSTNIHPGGPTKRMNHLSYASGAPPTGADVKTRTIAATIFARQGSIAEYQGAVVPTEVQSHIPEHADCHGVVITMEDPWTVYRDGSDPTQPETNFKGAYPRAMMQSTPVGRGLVFGGGTPYVYDGQRTVELGYVYFPEIIDWEVQAAEDDETDELDAGQHQIFAVYTWRDSAGQLHRSRPSNVVTFTANALEIITVYVRTMTLSMKDATAYYSDAPSISIELFATAADATVFYRVFGSDRREPGPGPPTAQSYRPRDIPANDSTAIAGMQTIYFGLPDSRLTTHQTAPTEFSYDVNGDFNGPLPVSPPAMSVVTTFQNRLWGADSLDPSVLWYSDEIIPEPGGEYYTVPEFDAEQFFRLGDIGEVTGLAVLDSQLVVFTRNSIHAVAVSDAGGGLLNVLARPIHEGIGCISPRSIVSYPLGLRFQSDKGVYDLARSGEASYGVLARSRDQPQSTGGAALEDKIANAGNILAAAHDPTKHQIRYVANDRPTVTQTWTLQVTVDGITGGLWTISGMTTTPLYLASAAEDETDVATALEASINTQLAADAPTTLQFQVASVDRIGNILLIELLPDVELTLSGTGPGAGTIAASVAEELETRPRVLVDHYDVQLASSFSLLQTSTSTRLSEVVGSCYWYGDGGARHVVQTQGATLIQHLTTDTASTVYADQTATTSLGIPIDITFAWLSLAGLAGSQCWDEIRVQTQRLTAATIQLDLQYDNEGLFDGEQLQPTTYSWTTTSRADLPARPRFRRVRSVRPRIYEASGITSGSETVRIVGLTAYVGVERGPKRVAAAQRGSV